MWSRAELKSRAKAVLRVSYWKAFIVSLVIAIAGGGKASSGVNWNIGRRSSDYLNNPFSLNASWQLLIFLAVFLVIFFFVFLFILAFRFFVGYPLEVGGRRYMVRSALNDENMNNLGFAFSKVRYADIVKSMLWRALFNFLWFLLFIIPGIVKAYAYSMVPYILTDNPNIGYKRALELSKWMTDGEKFNMFVLDLSFIGWYILGALALGVGVLFVMPYDNATKAQLYLVLRQNALDRGLCTNEELLLDSFRVE